MDLYIRHIYSSAWEEDSGDARAARGPADIVVCLSNKGKFIPPFVSFEQIEELRRTYRLSGEYLHGACFWSKHLVLVITN